MDWWNIVHQVTQWLKTIDKMIQSHVQRFLGDPMSEKQQQHNMWHTRYIQVNGSCIFINITLISLLSQCRTTKQWYCPYRNLSHNLYIYYIHHDCCLYVTTKVSLPVTGGTYIWEVGEWGGGGGGGGISRILYLKKKILLQTWLTCHARNLFCLDFLELSGYSENQIFLIKW